MHGPARFAATIGFTAVLLAGVVHAVSSAQDSTLAIEMTEGQLVTLDTRATSLGTLVRALCTKAGVQLRGFEAPDRPIAATYDNVPLRDVLQRLLRDETYMIGVRAGADPQEVEVAWIHVTASKIAGRVSATVPMSEATVTPPVPANAPSGLSGIGVPSEVIVDALASSDEAKRKAATLQIAEYLDNNPGSLDNFLSADVSANVDELTPYAYAHEALQTLSLREQNPVNRARLDGIAKSLRLKNGGPSKKPTFAELMQKGTPN